MTRLILFLLLWTMLEGCGVYSFTGASIDPNTETVTVQFFQNRASQVVPSLSQTFTEKLKDKLISDSALKLVNKDGDLDFSGAITSYAIRPQSVSGNDNALLNRLTIKVAVNYVNNDKEDQWEETFSAFADFEQTASLESVEDSLIEEITTQLVENIFNKALVNW